MRKLFAFNMVTLGGFLEGPNRDISWHNVDDKFNQFAIEQTCTVGAILFGRVTCELMASYWPTAAAESNDPVSADLNRPSVVELEAGEPGGRAPRDGNPVLIGSGTPLFKGIRQKVNLRLVKTRTFRSGNVLLHYQPAGK